MVELVMREQINRGSLLSPLHGKLKAERKTMIIQGVLTSQGLTAGSQKMSPRNHTGFAVYTQSVIRSRSTSSAVGNIPF